jgi:hypothetical protein
MHELFIHERYNIPKEYIHLMSAINNLNLFQDDLVMFCDSLWRKCKGNSYKFEFSDYKIEAKFIRTNIVDKYRLNIYFKENIIINFFYIHELIYNEDIQEECLYIIHFLYSCKNEKQFKDFRFFYKLLA